MNSDKIIKDFVISESDKNAKAYSAFSLDFGLFQTERDIFLKHVDKEHVILDLGCGTGRTTFGLKTLGYSNIIGCDISPYMIKQAKNRAMSMGMSTPFFVQDARDLQFSNDHFDEVFFSYSGLMTIPGYNNRKKAVDEISRVLKKGGKFIFSSYDRNCDPQYKEFWEQESARWQRGDQNKKLMEFGDIIKTTQLESEPVFIHFPDLDEIKSYFSSENGLTLVEILPSLETNKKLYNLIKKLQYFIVEKTI